MAKTRILLIEDDASQRRLFKTVLENAGYDVLEAENGETGVQLYRQQPCDLIITDIFMPQEDGIETLFDVKAQDPHVRVIAVSGGGRWAPHGVELGADEPLEMAKRFGADRTLKKPVKLRQLLALVDELLNIKGRLYSDTI
jgi:CheY-like chemotaxis protein